VNIVLSSGFLIPQTIGPIHYFRDVKPRLEAKGHRVLAHRVPPVASCKARARTLADGIQAKFNTDPVHIIAHSMGGLDCRMMIGENFNGLGETGRVLSLTTLSTPHQGSPLADLLAGKGPEDVRRRVFDALEKVGIDIGGLRDLTSDVDGKLPDVPKDFPHIHCRSYAASGRSGSRPTTFGLLPSHAYIKHKTGQDNDGAVAVASATYGEFKGAWPCDHLQVVGHNFDPPPLFGRIGQSILGVLGLGSPQFDHLARFDEIVDELQAVDGNRVG
jgi:triacylglycerol lipase